MNIEDMIFNGASEEEIAEALKGIYKEKARQEEQLRKAAKEERAEGLKREGRIYLVNALVAYGEAFDLLNPIELSQEDIDALEEAIVKAEKEIPKYIKMFEMLGMNIEDLFKEE